MFHPKLWSVARHWFDPHNTKQSVNVGIGAGVAILATGSGVLPALMAASVACSGAVAVRALWDEYKKKNQTPNHEQITVQWKKTIEPTAEDATVVKASTYNNFLDTLKSAVRGGTSMSHVSWMDSLSNRIDVAINVAEQKKEGVDILRHLKNETRAFAEPHVQAMSTKTFLEAMNQPVKNGLHDMVDSVNYLSTALRTNALLKSINPGGDTADNTRLHDWRMEQLKNKFNVVKNTFDNGISIGARGVEGEQRVLAHVVESMDRIQGQISPSVPVIVAEPLVSEAQAQMVARQQAKDQVYNAWNDSFDNVGANMSKAVVKLNAFHATLLAHNKKNGEDAAGMLLAEQLYDRLAMAQGFQGGDTHMFVQLENLKQSTQEFIQVHAANTASSAITTIESKPTILGNYDEAMGQTIATRDAARLQAVAARFAPEASDELSAKRIEDNLGRIKAALALGMDESTGSKIINSFLTTPEAINQEIGQAQIAVDTMRERMQEAQPKLDNSVALG